ncbi:hypothetical protein NUU61_001900 [Penicillium alfredii]|uniref:Alpha-1,2-mannosyltransferase n=1 Tax=Penicillium alfredii TaxID=1506179 RepID=A0A9W9FQP1_9EURO|nr:uncharacterized protein NUU61_001900 [Penicillium alfredii]KAJ5104553.1 hypothetical protein NUU61_001900 [Penicillium alfredii]
MDPLKYSDGLWRIGLILVSATAVYYLLSRGLGKSLLAQVTLNRRDRTSRIPPRSFSPEQKSAGDSASSSSYSHTLPPQCRQVLTENNSNAAPPRDAREKEVRRNILPMTADYQTSPGSKYTPTGFSVQEVKVLGDFPDYATLSGVPLPSPYHDFDIDKALPRPYRPFRWAYHQTMSLTKLETDWWIELENTYKSRIAQRKDLFATNGKAVLDALPGSELACKEMMEMALQFICARYPQYFTLEDNRMLHNRILGTEQDIRAKHPLGVLLDNVPEDFAVMMRDDVTGSYFLRAAVICSAMGWNVATKIGRPLHEIHAPIPDYKEKMQFSMERFFTKMPTEKPIQRASWGLEMGEPLYMAPGDPQEQHRLSQDPDLSIKDCSLRVDWQTLRRLPLSGAMVFNFKALFTPITEFQDEPAVPALVAKILKEAKHSFMVYKGVWHVQHVVLPKLEEWAKEQEENGVVAKDWQVATLSESPWFRDWEVKWHRQQGF